MIEMNNECLTSSEKTMSGFCVSCKNLTVSQQVLQGEIEWPGLWSMVRPLSVLVCIQISQKMHLLAI